MQAIADLEFVASLLPAPLEEDEEPALQGSMLASKAAQIVRIEQPVARLVATAEDVMYGRESLAMTPIETAELAREALSPWRFTFAGLGPPEFEGALRVLAPVQVWGVGGERQRGAPSPRCGQVTNG